MPIGTPTIGTLAFGASGNVTAPGTPSGSGQGVSLQFVHSRDGSTYTLPGGWTEILRSLNGVTAQVVVIGQESASGPVAGTAITRGGTTGTWRSRCVWVPGATMTGFLAGTGHMSSAANIAFGVGLSNVPADAIVFAAASKANDWANVGVNGDTTSCSPMGTHSGLTWTELYEVASGNDGAGVVDYSGPIASLTTVGTTGSITSAGSAANIAVYFSLAATPPAAQVFPKRAHRGLIMQTGRTC